MRVCPPTNFYVVDTMKPTICTKMYNLVAIKQLERYVLICIVYGLDLQ